MDYAYWRPGFSNEAIGEVLAGAHRGAAVFG
jgi:hypothetical protein